MIDFGEDYPAVDFLGLYGPLKSHHRLLNGVIARLRDQPGLGSIRDGQPSHEQPSQHKGNRLLMEWSHRLFNARACQPTISCRRGIASRPRLVMIRAKLPSYR